MYRLCSRLLLLGYLWSRVNNRSADVKYHQTISVMRSALGVEFLSYKVYFFHNLNLLHDQGVFHVFANSLFFDVSNIDLTT